MTTVTIVDESHTVAVNEPQTTVEVAVGASAADAVLKTLLDAKGDLLAATAADTVARLPAGTDGQVLEARASETTGLKWVAAGGSGVPATIVDAKGDLIVATAADTVARLAVGTARQRLIADSTPSTGLKWVDQDVFNVKHFGALGDSTTNDKAAIQAAIDACDTNRGGTVFFPQGRYRIATGLTVTYQGTRLLGEGMPGNGARTENHSSQGSSRIISDNGVTAITCNAGTHGTLGFAIENLHVLAASGATTGNGITIEDAERTLIRNVTSSDYIGGYGLRLNGSNTQYAHLTNYSSGDCLYGLYGLGGAANGINLYGGYFEGKGHTPRSGSVAIWLDTGDTCRLFGPIIQGYETGIFLDSPGNGHQVYGPRFEYTNIGIRVGASSVGASVFGGSWSNNLLTGGGSSIGIQVDSGAANTVLLPGYMATDITTKVSDAGTDTLYWTNNGVQPLVLFPGTVGVNNATATHMGGGVGVLAFKTADTNPSTNPTGGGVLYVDAGALKYRGASGTVTTLGVA